MPDQRAADAPGIIKAMIERSGMLREQTPERSPSPPAPLPAAGRGESPISLPSPLGGERPGVRGDLAPLSPLRGEGLGVRGMPATIEFIHNTFKEYLAALRLVHEHDADGLLARHAMRPDWLPVVLFAAATDKPGFASGLIRKIVPEIVGGCLGSSLRAPSLVPMQPLAGGSKTRPQPPGRADTRKKRRGRAKPKPDERELRQRMLLALRCKGIALEVESELLEQLQTEFRALFPPKTMADAEALAEVLGGENQELAASFLDELDYSHELVDKQVSQDAAAKCIRALRLIGTDHSQRRLGNYAQAVTDDQWPVLTELAQAMNPLAIPAVQRMVQRPVESGEEWQKQESIRSQIVDLSPLAGLSGLTELNLRGTRVSDLSPLAGLKKLESIYIRKDQEVRVPESLEKVVNRY